MIFVDDDVPHGVHFHPGEFGMAFLDFARDVPRCLPDDLKVAQYRIYGLFVVFKLVKSHALRVPLDAMDAFQNIPDAHLPVSRRHGSPPAK
jgi:hypothetical protein